jgi:uncharacterized membrane protein YphA (DoxX/SURF4 family)
MLAIFPTLLSFPLFSYFILRLALGFSLVKIGWQRKNKNLAYLFLAEIIAAIFLIIGLWTQIFAILSVLFLLTENYLDKKSENKTDSNLLFILIVVSLALIFTGPGAFAFDMPL